MKRITDIDAFGSSRPPLSDWERENLRRDLCQQQKDDGYQRLTELCRLGEYDAAKQLAFSNPDWGYEIVDGEVMEKID